MRISSSIVAQTASFKNKNKDENKKEKKKKMA